MPAPEAQDKVFDTIFGDYVKKYGEQGAASMWFTGRPQASDVKDVLGTTGRGYIDKYMAALGKPGTETPTGQGGTGGTTDTTNPYLDVLKTKEKEKKGGWETFGEGIADAAGAMAKAGQGFGYNIPAQPGPARVDVPSAPIVNPQQMEMRRQQLALAMQKLNQGTLS